MKNIFLILLLFLSSGCGQSDYLLKRPRVFGACSSFGNRNFQEKSLKSILLALNSRRGWSVIRTDKDKFLVLAKVRGRGVSKLLHFKIIKNGDIHITLDKSYVLYYDSAGLVKEWLDALERIYNKNRCK